MRLRPTHLLAGVAAAVAVAGAVTYLSRDGADESRRTLPAEGVEADTELAPRVVLFGDTVLARVEVVVDPARVDPRSVRVTADFTPFEVVRRSEADPKDVGDAVVLRTTLELRCATGNCVPAGPFETYELAPARISFAAAAKEGAAAESPLRARLPSVRVYSRFAALNSAPDRSSSPWQADVVSLPSVSYRLDHRLLLVLLLAGATLAALAGLALAYAAWPRRVAAPPPEPEPEPPPALSPLEQALALLEESIVVDGAHGRRRALELVAEELERADWGDREIAGIARALAWSEDVPDLDATSRVAARVRSVLPREEEEDVATGGGDVA